MKTTLLIFSLLVFRFSGAYEILGQDISFEFENIPFTEFCDSVYSQTGVIVYYDELLVKNLIVTVSIDTMSIEQVINNVLEGTGLELSSWHNNLIILSGEKLISGLPAFDKRSNNIEKESDISLTSTEKRYIEGRRPDVNKVITIGKNGSSSNNSNATIMGKIVSKETGEPAIGATMYIEETKTGAMTNENGFVYLVLKPGKYNVKFECLGLEKENYLFNVHSNGSFHIEMNSSIISIGEVVISGDRQIKITTRDAGLVKISSKTIKEVPMMMGEQNVLKISEMLPGIVSVGEGSAGLNVRGGNADQNAFYLNKIPIYNTSHLFGFFPAFNSEIVKDFSIYKGHVPAEYGGSLSSVFDIKTRQGNRKRFTVHGGISPVATNLTLEGPLKKDSCSMLLSLRSSYSDWILSKIRDPFISNSSVSFKDFAIGFNNDMKKTQLSVFGYYSHDNISFYNISDYKYSNAGASVSLRYKINQSIRGDLSFIGSQYSFSTIDKNEVSSAFEYDYKISHFEIRNDFDHHLNNHTLSYGIDLIYYKLNRGTVLPYGPESLKVPLPLGEEQGVENSLYISDRYKILPWMSLTMGLRYSLYAPLGPQTVSTYAPGEARDVRYIEDSLFFGSNKVIKLYHSPEIRAALTIDTDLNGSVKLAFNQSHQNLFMLNNTVAIAPNSQWKLADYHLRPSTCNQISVGVFRNIPKGSWEASAELFYKSTKKFTEFKDGADFMTSTVETSVLQGKQKAYGIEFMLKRNRQKIDGWLSYTYSRSFVQVDGGQSWNSINNGEIYNSNYDIPHVVNALISYRLGRHFVLSSVLTYQTGKPITYPISMYYLDGVQYTHYSKRNEYRIPDYFRADLSLKVEGSLKRNKLIHSSWMFSVYNLTGRKNAYSVYFETEDRSLESYKYSVIGVPIFTATWVFKLGNYASD